MTDAAPAPRPGVLLDVDGTLLDTNYLQVLAWWQAFRDTGHPEVSMADCHRAIVIGSAELVTHLLGDDVPDTGEVVESKGPTFEVDVKSGAGVMRAGWVARRATRSS